MTGTMIVRSDLRPCPICGDYPVQYHYNGYRIECDGKKHRVVAKAEELEECEKIWEGTNGESDD